MIGQVICGAVLAIFFGIVGLIIAVIIRAVCDEERK